MFLLRSKQMVSLMRSNSYSNNFSAGSKGVHLRLGSNEKNLIEYFAKLGFLEVSKGQVSYDNGDNSGNVTTDKEESNVIFLGRSL